MKKSILFLIALLTLLSCEQATTPAPTLQLAPIDYINVFSIDGYNGTDTTPLDLRGDILTYDGTDYNITGNSNPFTITTAGDIRKISLWIYVDSFSSFYFMNNNMLTIKGIDPQNMSELDFLAMLNFIYSPEDNRRFYRLDGYNGGVTESDNIVVTDSVIVKNGVSYVDPELNRIISGEDTIFTFWINRDNKDSFLFTTGTMMGFFNIDLGKMTRAEFIIAADIMNRYPEETLAELSAEYNP